LYFREEVERIIVERLCDREKDKKEVKEEEFNVIIKKLNSLMNYFARERKVQGFTDDDFRSFMVLKLHQVLRRDIYDENKSHYRFFIKVFNNLITDINRTKDRYLKHMDADGIDTCIGFGSTTEKDKMEDTSD